MDNNNFNNSIDCEVLLGGTKLLDKQGKGFNSFECRVEVWRVLNYANFPLYEEI